MKRGSIIRIISWGIVAFIMFAFSISGLVLFKNGHGRIGSIMKETKPLVTTFNNLKGFEQFNKLGISITAKAKNDNIVVSYDTDVSVASFTFNYKIESGMRLLTIKYNVVDNTMASVITKYMIDAIAVSKGYPEGKVFEKFALSDFEKTTPEQGVNIKTVDKTTTAILNMDTSILDSNIDLDGEINSITVEQAANIVEDLSPGSSIANKTGNLTVHINMYDTYYTLYIRDNKEIYSKSIYESVKSFIQVLSGEDTVNEFTTVCPEFNNVNYENEDSNIKIIYNSTGANAYTEFTNTNKVLEVDVKVIK